MHNLDFDSSVTCERKIRRSIDTLETEMACTTRHVTLTWHLKKKKHRCQSTLFFVSENIT